jgi:sarcosine oxidase subunit delta
MLLIRCPYCEEERPELEFRHAGEAHIVRSTEMSDLSDEEFEKFFFIRQNPKGLIFERWRHVHGCGRFFNAARDTVTDKFHMTYKAGEPKPEITVMAPPGPAAWANRDPAELNVDQPANDTGAQ